jgi:hypothetical protein
MEMKGEKKKGGIVSLIDTRVTFPFVCWRTFRLFGLGLGSHKWNRPATSRLSSDERRHHLHL